jgi:hypothetical protein
VGEEQALRTLNTLIAKAALVNEEDIQKKGNPSLSHCIHHLCIDTIEFLMTPIRSFHQCTPETHRYDDGLRHLSDLTLHTTGNIHPTTFLESLRNKCPHLKNVYLTDFFRNLITSG